MEGVYHVHVVKVSGCRLVGNVYGMLEGEVPYGEGLKLGIACPDATLVLMVELGKAGGHLAAAGAGGGDHHKGALGLDVFVAAKALFADDKLNVGGIAHYGVMAVYLYAQLLQTTLEGVRRVLALILGKHHAANVKADAAEGVDKAHNVQVVGYAKVAPHLILLDIGGVYYDDYLRMIRKLHQHAYLAVRLKARQHPCRVKVVKQLAAKLHIKLAAKLAQPVPYMLGLQGQVFFVIKTQFHISPQIMEMLKQILKYYIPPGQPLQCGKGGKVRGNFLWKHNKIK